MKDICQFEEFSGICLPEDYKKLLLKYGGGYFGFANLYSLDKKSQFYIVKNNTFPLGDYLNIGDNGCGDYYASGKNLS